MAGLALVHSWVRLLLLLHYTTTTTTTTNKNNNDKIKDLLAAKKIRQPRGDDGKKDVLVCMFNNEKIVVLHTLHMRFSFLYISTPRLA